MSPGTVIIGSGLAGYGLARELRRRDRRRAITVLTADGGESYAKPALSNALAQGRTADALVQADAAAMAERLAITVRPRSRVTAIDRTAKRLALGTGGEVAYDDLVLALGADPRPCALPGGEALATVNDLDGYRRWRHRLAGAHRVLVLGAGLVGCEMANDLAAAGFSVTLVDPAPWPLARLLPEPLGRALADALTEAGIGLRIGRRVVRIAGGEALLDDGESVAFDAGLAAIGIVPRTALAAAAGLGVDGGIVVDSLLATSDPAIHAIGDCARTEAGVLPFVMPLMREVRALAATLAGSPAPLVLPAMAVVVKTPALAVTVCPPPAGVDGRWCLAGEGRDLTALFHDAAGRRLGFALTGAATARRQALAA